MQQIIEIRCTCLAVKVNDFNALLDSLPKHSTVTRTRHQFDLVTFGIATARLTLATYNAVQISKLKTKMAANKKKVDHLINLTNLHEQISRWSIKNSMTSAIS